MSGIFDGSTTNITRNGTLKGVSNSKKGTLSMWFYLDSLTDEYFLAGDTAGSVEFRARVSGVQGVFQILGENAADTHILDLRTSGGNPLSASTLYHIGASWDLGTAGARHLYVNGTSNLSVSTFTDDTLDYAGQTRWTVGAHSGGAAGVLDGRIHDIAFWPGVYMDLSDEDTLQRLVADDSATDRLHTSPAGVKPVGYGREGRYMDLPAAIYFSGDFQRNLGTGGAFTPSDTFDEDDPSTDAALTPNPFRLFPRWQTPGERWYLSEQGGEPWPKGQMVVEQREGLNSYGKRIALEEVDDRTRRERPGMLFSDLVLGVDEEDHEDDFLR